MARFDEGPSAGRGPDGAARRPQSLSDYPSRPPAAPVSAAPGLSAPNGPAFGRPEQSAASDPNRSAPGHAGGSPEPLLALTEPTETLPTVKPLKAAARAVIVYQEVARRPWRLWAFTAVLVALTVGVILGQTVAFEPTYRSGSNAQAAVVPTSVSPAPSASAVLTAPLSPAWPDAAHRVTAPLGATRSLVLEVVGTSAVLHVRSVDLGKSLYDIGTIDRSAVPRMTATRQAASLSLIPTGDDGTVGAEIQLNSKVSWTLKLAGGLTEQSVDMQAGGLAGLQLTGGSAHTALLLPAPVGTVPLTVKGPRGDLTVSTKTSVPLRIKLTDGTSSAVVNGQPHHDVKPGTTLTPADWAKARNRYDLTTTGKISAVLATTSPPPAGSSPSPSSSAAR